MFKDSTCISASGIRLPNTGASSGSFIHATAIVDISNKTPFTISARCGSKTVGPTLLVGDRFNGLSDPFITIQEFSRNL